MQVGNIFNSFRKFLVNEFRHKVCGEAESLKIGYFRGNKGYFSQISFSHGPLFCSVP